MINSHPGNHSDLLIGITCCRKPGHEGRKDLDDFVVGEKYIRAIQDYVGLPWPIVPDQPSTIARLCEQLDGLVLTGSLSNVHPDRYKVTAFEHHKPFDQQRDAMTWTLLDHATKRKMPILAICRGIQELNVYCGGSLHALVHEVGGFTDHRAPHESIDADDTLAMYHPHHGVNISPGGVLASIFGPTSSVLVNSLHKQGIDRLGNGLQIEATAPDGLIEAVSLANYEGWSLGVQWHPEFQTERYQSFIAIFTAFKEAADLYRRQQCQNKHAS